MFGAKRSSLGGPFPMSHLHELTFMAGLTFQRRKTACVGTLLTSATKVRLLRLMPVSAPLSCLTTQTCG